MSAGDQAERAQTTWELRTERNLRNARASGDQQKIAELQALLAGQRQAREAGESLVMTLNDIQKEVLLRAWKISDQRSEARMAGFFWGAIWVIAAWIGWATGLRELGDFFLGTLGLPSGLALPLTMLTWGGGLLLLFQRGLWGTTVLHVFVAWCRQQTKT